MNDTRRRQGGEASPALPCSLVASVLPSSLTAMVESFNELLPGMPWNDSIVDAIFWGVANNGCSLGVPIYVTHGSADLELELHNSLSAKIVRPTKDVQRSPFSGRSPTPPSGSARGLQQRKACWSCCWRPGESLGA